MNDFEDEYDENEDGDGCPECGTELDYDDRSDVYGCPECGWSEEDEDDE